MQSNEELLDDLWAMAGLNRNELPTYKVAILKRMAPTPPAPIAAQTEKPECLPGCGAGDSLGILKVQFHATGCRVMANMAAPAEQVDAARLEHAFTLTWKDGRYTVSKPNIGTCVVIPVDALKHETQPPSVYDQLVGMFGKDKLDGAIEAAKHPTLRDKPPEGCYCPPDKCQAPTIMGRQMPCRRKSLPTPAPADTGAENK